MSCVHSKSYLVSKFIPPNSYIKFSFLISNMGGEYQIWIGGTNIFFSFRTITYDCLPQNKINNSKLDKNRIILIFFIDKIINLKIFKFNIIITSFNQIHNIVKFHITLTQFLFAIPYHSTNQKTLGYLAKYG